VANAAATILTVLDRQLTAASSIRLMGGAALILAYGLDRATEDADLLLDDAEAKYLAEHCDFGEALERANRELEPLGLYVSHIWGPEQAILTPEWRASCRSVPDLELSHLTVEALGPLDLVVSKLARGDQGDLDDIRYLLEREHLSREVVLAAMRRAQVPEILRGAFDEAVGRLTQMLASLPE
jgi:hypothetical protein